MPKKTVTDDLAEKCLEVLKKEGAMTHMTLWGKLGGAVNHPAEVYRAAMAHPGIEDFYANRGFLSFRVKQ